MPSLSDVTDALKNPAPKKQINPTMKAFRDSIVNYLMNASQRTGESLADMVMHPEHNIPMPGNLGIISPGMALRLPKLKSLYSSPSAEKSGGELLKTISNSNALLTNEGALKLPVARWQNPEQAGHPARSGGVFYVPKQHTKTYSGIWNLENKPNTAYSYWGGPQEVTGWTVFKNPYFSKEGGGGDAVAKAGKELFGEPDWNSLQIDKRRAMGNWNDDPRHENVLSFLKDYAPGVEIPPAPKGGDLRAYKARLGPWLEESAVGNKARNEGYDSIIQYGYSPMHYEPQRMPTLGEIFDLRESNYPVPGEEGKMWPHFQNLMK